MSFATKPQTAVAGDGLHSEVIEDFALFLLRLGIGEIRIAPLDSPFVIVVDAREDAFRTDVVFGLCHIVETSIVHNRRGVPVGFHPFLVAEFLHGSSRTGAHIVAQTEGVSHFVRRNKTDELSHQFFVKFLFARARIDSSSLHHIPVVY